MSGIVWSGMEHSGTHECVDQSLFGVLDWITKGAESLLLTARLKEVTSTAESSSRSDSRLCGLPSVSTSLTFTASDLVVLFQPRWSAPPRPFTPLSKTLSTFHLRLSDEPRRARSFLLSFCIAGFCMRCFLQCLTDYDFDMLRTTTRRDCRIFFIELLLLVSVCLVFCLSAAIRQVWLRKACDSALSFLSSSHRLCSF